MAEVRVHEVPDRLKKDFQDLFPSVPLNQRLRLISVSYPTVHPMTAVSTEMLEEREKVFSIFCSKAQAFVKSIPNPPNFADFVDPSTGAPFNTQSPTFFAETDERVSHFGFEVVEFGCCRALAHPTLGHCLVCCFIFVHGDCEIDTASFAE
eukprot:GEMP01070310.1.p1 GENE.GEMP01070310.1~~GEMP01070310.1.p1  ORF type:complete len:151 (+),score=31.68 GEMP01070310.1:147-599(+)